MGLHQTQAAPEGISDEETPERFKVFRALYVRDKSCAISRGSVCWLPSYDCSLVSQLGKGGDDESEYADRIRLAMAQDEIYRLAHSAESQRQLSDKFKSALSRVEQSLERWATAYGPFEAAGVGGNRAIVQLEFLAARLSAFRDSSDARYARRALTDARASCLLLLIACGMHDSAMIEQFDSLPIANASRVTSKDINPQCRAGKAASQDPVAKTTTSNAASEPSSLRYHALLETFSISAVFLLAKSVFKPADIDDAQMDADLDLLQKVWACYKDYDSRVQANNYVRKVARAFGTLLELIKSVKSPQQQLLASPPVSYWNSLSPTPPNAQVHTSGGTPGLADFDFSSFPACPTPPNSTIVPVDSWSAKRMSSYPSTGGSVTTNPSKHSNMAVQAFDSRQLTHQLPEHGMLPPSSASRKRPRTHVELDAWIDDFSNSNLLSDFIDA